MPIETSAKKVQNTLLFEISVSSDIGHRKFVCDIFLDIGPINIGSSEMKANENRCELLNTSAYEKKVVGKVNRIV